MKLNLVIIFLVAVVGSLGTIYWKVDRDFYTQKIRWNESQSRAQISAIAHSIETEIEGLTQVLDLAYPIVSEIKHDYNDDQVFSKFQMISRLQKTEAGDLNLTNKFFLEKSSVKSWAANYVYFALKSMKNSSFEKAKVQVLQDPQKRPWLLFVVKSSVTQNTYAAILQKEFFQAVMDRQKGQLGKVSLLNEQGQVLAHAIAEYIGMDLREDDLVKEIMANSQQSGSGFFNGLEGERNHGFYEKSEKNDLYVTVSTPVVELMMERAGLKKKFIFMGIGIIFVGLAFLFFVDPSREAQEQNEQLLSLLNQAQKRKDQSTKKNTELVVPASAKTVEKEKEPIGMLPPVPAGIEDESVKAGFEQLFSHRKIEEAFDMIDNLDSPPRQLSSVEKQNEQPKAASSLPTDEEKTVVVPLSKPLIQMQKRESKLDQFEVMIRRPGERL